MCKDDVDHAAAVCVLRFMYGESITVNQFNVLALMHWSSFWQVGRLIDTIAANIERAVNRTNVLSVIDWLMREARHWPAAIQFAVTFFKNNAEAIGLADNSNAIMAGIIAGPVGATIVRMLCGMIKSPPPLNSMIKSPPLDRKRKAKYEPKRKRQHVESVD